MRDVVNTDGLDQEETYWNGQYRTAENLWRKARRSQRSDVLKTTKVGDTYLYTTEYEAFFSTSSARAGSASWREFDYTTQWRLVQKKASGSGDRGYWSWGTNSYLRPAVPDAVISRARQKAIEQIRANNLQPLVTVAELKATVQTITSILQDIVWIVKRFRSSVRTQVSLANEWLRYQYGVKPLMSDIASSIEIIKNGLQEPLAKVTGVSTDTTYTLPPNDPLYGFTFTGSVKRGVEVGYYLRLTDPLAFKTWQLGLNDLLSFAWELTTLSFVADWFLHVGDFLAALNRPLGLSVVTGYQTSFLRNSIRVERDLIRKVQENGQPIRISQRGSSGCDIASTSMHRVYLGAVAVPLPYLDVVLNLDQALSALALIRSRIPR